MHDISFILMEWSPADAWRKRKCSRPVTKMRSFPLVSASARAGQAGTILIGLMSKDSEKT
jgi:hypothetical protein